MEPMTWENELPEGTSWQAATPIIVAMGLFVVVMLLVALGFWLVGS